MSSLGTYYCICQTGYQGLNCSTPINQCNSQVCANGATCVYTGPGSFACICPAGYTNTRCQDTVNNCASGPCQNSGTCVSNINSYSCYCQQGYTGINCEIIINVIFLFNLNNLNSKVIFLNSK